MRVLFLVRNCVAHFHCAVAGGILYTVARREKYNVLALAQHLDDLCESFLMSAFHNGRLRTMKAHYSNKAGDIRIIRPLIYTRERATRQYAEQARLPVIAENCPACFEGPKERYRIKTLLAQQEHLFPDLLSNLLRTMTPLLKDSTFASIAQQHGAVSAASPPQQAASSFSNDGEDF